jgi:hypothetical protein
MTLLWCSVLMFTIHYLLTFLSLKSATHKISNFWKCITIPNPPLQSMKKTTLHIIITTYFRPHWCAVTSSHTFTLRYYLECSYICIRTALTMSVLAIKHVLYTKHPSYDFTTKNLLTFHIFYTFWVNILRNLHFSRSYSISKCVPCFEI